MICVSFSDKSILENLKQLEKYNRVEIRMDMMMPSMDEIVQIFSSPVQLIATCKKVDLQDEKRFEMLKTAIESGAAFIDIDLDEPRTFRKELMKIAKDLECTVIISWHNYKFTPDKKKLTEKVEECFKNGADIAKVVCMSHSAKDSARISGLYDTEKPLIAFGMGEEGRFSRIASLALGAPFTYAYPDESKATAPGQLSFRELKQISELLNL